MTLPRPLVLVVLVVLALAAAAGAQSFASFESPQFHPIAVAADGLRLYVVNTPDARLAVYDLRTPARPRLLLEIPVGLEPVSVCPRTRDEVWVVDHLSDAVSVVDTARGLVVGTLHTGDEPSDVVFAQGKAFVSIATRRRVEVFDAATRVRVGAVPLFADEPRALAVSRDGSRVYVASHRSGNDTTIVPEALAPPQPPPTNPRLPAPPRAGLIVHSEDPQWSSAHNVVLPDDDVFEIDAATLAVTRAYRGVGTVLFDIAVHPTSGQLWVANTQARNLVRFEPALRGHAIDSRITRIVPGAGGTVTPIDLNPGIDYGTLPNPPARQIALSQPTAVAFAPDGGEAYVAAFATDRIGVLDALGAVLARIEVGGTAGGIDPRHMRGPRGLAHHPTQPLLYVHNRLRNSLSVVDTRQRAVLAELAAPFDPLPAALKEGRGFLYDARLSGNGTMSCASCHVDAQLDGLAWDLGDPGGEMITVSTLLGPIAMHPMKGAMNTQTLQGLASSSPFHWRGDRARFQDFNPAFDKLMGGTALATADIDDYTRFIETVPFPPNPNLNRDRSLPTTPIGLSAADGRQHYVNEAFRSGLRCVDCHVLGTGSNRLIIPATVLQEAQAFKVPQLRNVYKKNGRIAVGGQRTSGFGLLHDGSIDSEFALLSLPVFGSLASDATRKARLQAFVEAFDTGLAPTVGFARTLDQTTRSDAQVIADVQLLMQQVGAGNCDLAVRGRLDGEAVGLTYDPSRARFDADRASEPARTFADLDALVAQGRAVFTLLGVLRGQGVRAGRDRDGDGRLDGDEAARAYGQGTPACGLVLAANSPPSLGNGEFAFTSLGAPAHAYGVLVLGTARTSLPIFGVELLVDAATGFVLDVPADARGMGLLPLPIPAAANLVGLTLHAQAVYAASCGPQGVAASNGLTLVIGS